MKKVVYVAVGILCVVAGILLYAQTQTAALPSLGTDGTNIIRTDTGEPVILRGAVSDYFRYGRFNIGLQQRGLAPELKVLRALSRSGGNVIGLYISDPEMLYQHITELDSYVQQAQELRMYVYLMPVAREFNGESDSGDRAPQATYDELKHLETFLAHRYGTHANVLYGFGAEPDRSTALEWDAMQRSLAELVLAEAPNALLIVTGDRYLDGLDYYLKHPFPYKNVVYAGGGYMGASDTDRAAHPKQAQTYRQSAVAPPISATAPYLASEFGGNYGANFSSEGDIREISSMLNELAAANRSYTMYRLSANMEEDGLALFDQNGNAVPRGTALFENLAAFPPTRF